MDHYARERWAQALAVPRNKAIIGPPAQHTPEEDDRDEPENDGENTESEAGDP